MPEYGAHVLFCTGALHMHAVDPCVQRVMQRMPLRGGVFGSTLSQHHATDNSARRRRVNVAHDQPKAIGNPSLAHVPSGSTSNVLDNATDWGRQDS